MIRNEMCCFGCCSCSIDSADEFKGVAHARNVGLDIAKGKWLLFAHSGRLLSRQFHYLFR